MEYEDDRWWQEYERNRELELEHEDAVREREIERLYDHGGMGEAGTAARAWTPTCS